MKLAISTCQTGMIESLSSLFSEHELHVLGVRRMTKDWPFNMEISRNTWPYRKNVFSHFQDDEPIEKIDIQNYDLLVDVCESQHYNSQWRETAVNWDIPRIIYITNPAPKTTLIRKWRWLGRALTHPTHPIFHYYDKLKGYPIVYSNETLQRDWGLKGEVIHFTFDEWGIGGWVGDEKRMLFGKNGYYTWAPLHRAPLNTFALFSRLEQKLKKRFVVHDSSHTPMSERDWRDYVAHSRLWFEHDWGSTGRALTQGLVKAMALGLPVILWKTKICQGWVFINKFNGLVTDDVSQAIGFANRLLSDYNFAKDLSKNMVEAYRNHLSWIIAKPKWAKAIAKAFAVRNEV